MHGRAFSIVVAFTLLIAVSAQDISPGVRYKKAPTAVNEHFRQVLHKLLTGKAEDKALAKMFDPKVVMCGPTLYGVLKRQLPEAAQAGKPAHIVVPINGGQPQELEGRVYNTPDDIFDFATTVQGLCTIEPMKIRAPKRNEIDYYWAMIPYDIEEPIFVLEGPKHAVLINGNKDGQIVYVELLPRQLRQ